MMNMFAPRGRLSLAVGLLILATLLCTLIVSSVDFRNQTTSAQTPPYDEVEGVSDPPGPEVPLPSGPGSERNFRPPVPDVS